MKFCLTVVSLLVFSPWEEFVEKQVEVKSFILIIGATGSLSETLIPMFKARPDDRTIHSSAIIKTLHLLRSNC